MTDKATDVTVTQADRDAAADLLACDLGEPLSPADKFQLESIRSGLDDYDDGVQAFARHRTAHSGEGRSNGAGEVDPSKMSVEMADLFGLVCKLNRLKTERDDLMRTDGGFSVIERAADMMDEIVDAMPALQSAFNKVCERERLLLAALSAPQGEMERLRAEVADYRKLTAEQQKRIGKLEGAIMARPPIKPDDGSWWYPEGDTSSDACCHGPAEALEGAADQMAEGEARVVVLERALELPNVYAALRVFTDAERDERDDDEPWDFTLHATADDARAALAQPKGGDHG